MVNVLHEIVDWAQGLPGWQADAVRRLLTSGELTDDDEREVTAILLREYRLLASDEDAVLIQRPSRVDVRATATKRPDIKLLALRNLTNVNAIVPNQSLRFGKTGVTVVYGANASGKSGYARVLKRACRARDTNASIHPNVFGVASSEAPSAIFDLDVDGQEQSTSWVEGKPAPDLLADFAVFDSRCARVYIDEKNEVSYVPYGMDVFPKLVTLCTRIKERLVKERDAINSHPTFLDEFDEQTEMGKLILALNAQTPGTRVEEKARLSKTEQKRFYELDALVKRAEVESPKSCADTLRRFKARLLKLKEDVKPVLEALSDENVALLRSSLSKQKETAAVVKVASEEAFKDMPLEGVGSDPWRALFEAAKAYSEECVYPGQDFPVLATDSRCVLCQQILDDESQRRFKRFKDFITERAAREADSARRDFEQQYAAFQTIRLDADSQHTDVLAEIELRDVALTAELRTMLANVRPRHKTIQEAVKSNTWDSLSELLTPNLDRLDNLASVLEAEAESYDSANEQEGLDKARRECAELSQRMLASRHLSDILNHIEDLKRLEKLKKCIDVSLDTAPITKKNSRLMEQVTTETLRSALEKELRDLGIQRLQVSLGKTGSKGITLHQLQLAAQPAKKVLLSEILSEGEHRVVAIASFLSELRIASGTNGIVFDDPVCSLDHEFRERVAKRLVQEGRCRQVIVFTHDIVFYLGPMQFTTEELEEDLKELANFVTEIKQRHGRTETSRKELLRPPRP